MAKIDQKKRELMSELGGVVNRNCIDNDLGTPDYVIAQYLYDCLKAYADAKEENQRWHSS